MSRIAYIWLDLEFPGEGREFMGAWKQVPLDPNIYSDWGEFGPPQPGEGMENVGSLLANASRYVAREKIEGRPVVFSVALGPTQVKVRAALDEEKASWWYGLVLAARAAGAFGATGEWGWAARADGGWEGYVARIGYGGSEFARLGPEESRRLERHPAVVEIEKQWSAACASTPVPITFTAPPPRPSGVARRRKRGFRYQSGRLREESLFHEEKRHRFEEPFEDGDDLMGGEPYGEEPYVGKAHSDEGDLLEPEELGGELEHLGGESFDEEFAESMCGPLGSDEESGNSHEAPEDHGERDDLLNEEDTVGVEKRRGSGRRMTSFRQGRRTSKEEEGADVSRAELLRFLQDVVGGPMEGSPPEERESETRSAPAGGRRKQRGTQATGAQKRKARKDTEEDSGGTKRRSRTQSRTQKGDPVPEGGEGAPDPLTPQAVLPKERSSKERGRAK